ncbi:MAG: hypothetical protein MHPSP_004645, partial [Paramarteilia canceri]
TLMGSGFRKLYSEFYKHWGVGVFTGTVIFGLITGPVMVYRTVLNSPDYNIFKGSEGIPNVRYMNADRSTNRYQLFSSVDPAKHKVPEEDI